MVNALHPSPPVAPSARRRSRLRLVVPSLHRVAIAVLSSLLLSWPRHLVDASSIRRPGTSRKQTAAASSRPDDTSLACCRFAALSPPTVAAVCRDGVVLVAEHSGPALEPLLVPAARAGGEEQGEATSEEDTGDDPGTKASRR